ncbi:mucin-7-like [Penaeus vannamei]|uniref:mucin-7-like n=1 Tax=Penaeus vannamei TaxID=6689 RepID=UPI00387F8BBB
METFPKAPPKHPQNTPTDPTQRTHPQNTRRVPRSRPQNTPAAHPTHAPAHRTISQSRTKPPTEHLGITHRTHRSHLENTLTEHPQAPPTEHPDPTRRTHPQNTPRTHPPTEPFPKAAPKHPENTLTEHPENTQTLPTDPTHRTPRPHPQNTHRTHPQHTPQTPPSTEPFPKAAICQVRFATALLGLTLANSCSQKEHLDNSHRTPTEHPENTLTEHPENTQTLPTDPTHRTPTDPTHRTHPQNTPRPHPPTEPFPKAAPNPTHRTHPAENTPRPHPSTGPFPKAAPSQICDRSPSLANRSRRTHPENTQTPPTEHTHRTPIPQLENTSAEHPTPAPAHRTVSQSRTKSDLRPLSLARESLPENTLREHPETPREHPDPTHRTHPQHTPRPHPPTEPFPKAAPSQICDRSPSLANRSRRTHSENIQRHLENTQIPPREHPDPTHRTHSQNTHTPTREHIRRTPHTRTRPPNRFPKPHQVRFATGLPRSRIAPLSDDFEHRYWFAGRWSPKHQQPYNPQDLTSPKDFSGSPYPQEHKVEFTLKIDFGFYVI